MKLRPCLHSAFAAALLALLNTPVFAQPEITISKDIDVFGWSKPIPVSFSGFSGEVDSVLKNDLIFMGVVSASPDKAQYLVTGSNAGNVQGGVTEKFSKRVVLPVKGYAGGSLRRQAHALADDIAAALTGKAGIAQTRIAFKVEIGGGAREVYVADYDGHGAQAATHDGANLSAPCWAGRSAIYYSSYKFGTPQIFYQNLTTGQRQAVTRFAGSCISPAVSPDGKKLAMILSKSGSPDLYVSDLNGTNLKQLTFTKEDESSPCWSPDNQTICVVSRDSGKAQLYTVSAMGGAMRRISTAGVPNATEPDWSPDGKWLAFTTLMGGFQICLVKAGGGEAHVLVEGEDPTWAPNSRAIIFCKGRDHGKQLSLLDVPSKQVKDVARILESNSQPSWAK